MADIRDTYRTWADVPPHVQRAVNAYDDARRQDSPWEWPMSERNKTSIAPMIEAAIGAPVPIPMLLFCPNCGVQHVDAPEDIYYGGTSTKEGFKPRWDNPPHRSHLCGACGCIWRPADVPTEGVKAIETRGKADTWEAP